MKVYLAGGMKSGWQGEVMSKGPNALKYTDPREHGLHREEHYTTWDLLAIDQCDVLFIYFEASNPSGLGLNLEAGYAHAKGKTIVLVDEKSAADPTTGRRLGMLRSISDVVFENLREGIEYLWMLDRI